MKYTFDAGAHVHRLEGKPLIGTTSSLEIMGKVLTWWASSLACAELGWLKSLDRDKVEEAVKEERRKARISSADAFLLKLKAMNGEEYLKLLDKAYKAHSVRLKDTAEAGTDLHSACEEYIIGQMTGRGVLLDDPRLETFHKWCDANVEKFLFSELYTYSERLWVGGQADFGFISKTGKRILGDFKSSPKAYYNHFVQMGAYDIQLSESGGFTATGDKVVEPMLPFDAHAVFCFGGGFKEPVISYNTTRHKRSFEAALVLYKSKMEFEDGLI